MDFFVGISARLVQKAIIIKKSNFMMSLMFIMSSLGHVCTKSKKQFLVLCGHSDQKLRCT